MIDIEEFRNDGNGCNITVCMLSFNHAHLLESSVNSLLEQTISGYEVLISDDCSTDKSWDLIQHLVKKYPNVRAIKTPRNLGMAGNANFAVSNIDTPYIALLHHDDICRSDLLERWVDNIMKNDDVAFVFNPYAVYESHKIHRWNLPGSVVSGDLFLEKYLLPYWHSCVRGTAMIRKSAWISVGGMREQYGMLADIDLWMRLSAKWKVGYVDEPIIIVRHDRPTDYPDAYKEESWSWKRRKLLYEIHIDNRLNRISLNHFAGKISWFFFRLRLSLETFKWLIYAVLKNKKYMITTSRDSVTWCDFWFLKSFRSILLYIYK